MGSLALVFAFRGFRIAIFISILLWFLLSGCMYFWQRLGTDKALIGVSN
jgi:hypothetical protein